MPHLRRRACRRRSDDRLSRQLRQETGRIGMAGSKQTDRLMKFSSPLGKDVLLIESLEGAEGISRLFEYHAELLADAGTAIDPKSIVGSKVTIGIALSDVKGSRWINGIVASFEQCAGDKDFDVYRARIVPRSEERRVG